MERGAMCRLIGRNGVCNLEVSGVFKAASVLTQVPSYVPVPLKSFKLAVWLLGRACLQGNSPIIESVAGLIHFRI